VHLLSGSDWRAFSSKMKEEPNKKKNMRSRKPGLQPKRELKGKPRSTVTVLLVQRVTSMDCCRRWASGRECEGTLCGTQKIVLRQGWTTEWA
jgi:hypothetical protein